MDEIKLATKTMFERYLNDFLLEDNIRKLCIEGIESIDKLPIDKLSRWLGFVQGYVIFSNPQTTIEDERNFSRPIFQNAYKSLNMKVPTIGV